MLTYQLRKRTFRVNDGQTLSFPNSAEIVIVLQPLQPFGMEPGNGRTTVKDTRGSVLFNANTGQHFIESAQPLEPLDVTIEEPNRRWELHGNELRVLIEQCESNEELAKLINSLCYGLPILLNVEFADPPMIERIEGKVGDTAFRWELRRWQMDFEVTTQEVQEEKFITSWQRFELLSQSDNWRLVAALHYLHMASRLQRSGQSPWEFMAESILNLSKVLEVLFPPKGDGMTRDAARKGLEALGYSTEDIERNFLPSMALRNEIDVGHVDLSLYTPRQLHALHRYAETAEIEFRTMLQQLMNAIAAGEYQLSPYIASSAGSKAKQIIEKLERNFGED